MKLNQIEPHRRQYFCFVLFFPSKYKPEKGTRRVITYSSRIWEDRRERPWGNPPAASDTPLISSVWKENRQNCDQYLKHGVKSQNLIQHWFCTHNVSHVEFSELHWAPMLEKFTAFFSAQTLCTLMLFGTKERLKKPEWVTNKTQLIQLTNCLLPFGF